MFTERYLFVDDQRITLKNVQLNDKTARFQIKQRKIHLPTDPLILQILLCLPSKQCLVSGVDSSGMYCMYVPSIVKWTPLFWLYNMYV